MHATGIYCPLSINKNEIRILIIEPATSPIDPIHCDLGRVSLDGGPDYVALSYRWGDKSKKEVFSVNNVATRVNPDTA